MSKTEQNRGSEPPLISLTYVYSSNARGIDVDPTRIETVKEYGSGSKAKSVVKMYSGDSFNVAETREEISALRAEALAL